MSSHPIAAVTAATGTQGFSVTRALSAAGFHVRALTRSPNSEKTVFKLRGLKNVELVYFDVEDLGSVEQAFDGADVVFAVTIPHYPTVMGRPGTLQSSGLDEVAQGKRMADVMKSKDVKLSIWSSVPFAKKMADKYPDQLQRNAKIALNKYVVAAKLPAVFLDLGFFNDNLVAYKRAVLDGQGEVIYHLAHADRLTTKTYPHFSVNHDLGTIVSLVAHNFEKLNLNGRHIALIDRYYSLAEILATIEKVTGRKTHLNNLPVYGEPGSVYDNMFKSLGDPEVEYFEGATIPDPTLTQLGFKFQSFEDFCKTDLMPYLFGAK